MTWFNRANTFKRYMSFLLGFIYLWLTLQPAYCLRLRILPRQQPVTTWTNWLPNLAIFSFYGTILACLGVMCFLLFTLWPDVWLAFMDAVLKRSLTAVLDRALKLEQEHQKALRQGQAALAGHPAPDPYDTAEIFALRQLMRHGSLGELFDADPACPVSIRNTLNILERRYKVVPLSCAVLGHLVLRQIVFIYNAVAERLLAAEGEDIWERAWDRQGWPATGSYLNPALMLISRRTSTPRPRIAQYTSYRQVCRTYIDVSRQFSRIECIVGQLSPQLLRMNWLVSGYLVRVRAGIAACNVQADRDRLTQLQSQLQIQQATLANSERLLPEIVALIESYSYDDGDLISPVGSTQEQLTQWSDRAKATILQAAAKLRNLLGRYVDISDAESAWNRLINRVNNLLLELAPEAMPVSPYVARVEAAVVEDTIGS